jgi:hypothetical protein
MHRKKFFSHDEMFQSSFEKKLPKVRNILKEEDQNGKYDGNCCFKIPSLKQNSRR